MDDGVVPVLLVLDLFLSRVFVQGVESIGSN